MKRYKKATIFRIPQEQLALTPPDCAAQLTSTLECYNVTIEEEDDDLRNIDIPETDGQPEVQGPQVDNPDITALVNTKQVNIGTEVEPKFVKIGDYQDVAIVDKVVELLCEYQYLFPTSSWT